MHPTKLPGSAALFYMELPLYTLHVRKHGAADCPICAYVGFTSFTGKASSQRAGQYFLDWCTCRQDSPCLGLGGGQVTLISIPSRAPTLPGGGGGTSAYRKFSNIFKRLFYSWTTHLRHWLLWGIIIVPIITPQRRVAIHVLGRARFERALPESLDPQAFSLSSDVSLSYFVILMAK